MKKFDKRFTKEEFKKELVEHLKTMPADLKPAQLEKHAEVKAEHYARANQRLDEAVNALKSLAASTTDAGEKQKIDLAIKRVDEAIAAYGEASLAYNSQWDIARN